MPEAVTKRDVWKSFAVIDKVKDHLVLVTRAKKIHHITSKYPADKFKVWDVTGNDEIPYIEGSTNRDITIDSNGDWKLKVTPEEIEARKKAKNVNLIKRNICLLLAAKKEATTEGYTDIVAELEAQITELKNQLPT